MWKKTIYVSGRMSGIPHEEVIKKRKEVVDSLKELIRIRCVGWEVVNPAFFYNYQDDAHKSEKEIMQFELNLVRNSNLVVVDIEDVNKSIGSCIEVYEAYKNNIPVIAYGSSESWKNVHPWIKECVSRWEEKLLDACVYINDYYFW